jgi:hypothetical protein
MLFDFPAVPLEAAVAHAKTSVHPCQSVSGSPREFLGTDLSSTSLAITAIVLYSGQSLASR